MTIHHATLKKAAASNIAMEEHDDILAVRHTKAPRFAFCSELLAKDTLSLALEIRGLLLEYPSIFVEQGQGKDVRLHFRHAKQAEGDDAVVQIAIEDLVFGVEGWQADVLEAFAEQGFDPAEGEKVHVVVPEHYKRLYAERGDRNHCGDWLAVFLAGKFAGVDGRFAWQPFQIFLEENGVDLVGKWASLPTSGQKGWEGRYRMNGRQKLERKILENGVLVYKGDEVEVPEAFWDALCDKNPNVVPAR